MTNNNEIQIWGGVECTINRVGDQYFDQSEYSGHYKRGEQDIDLVGSLGIKMLRYPILWEKHLPKKDSVADWSFAGRMLNQMNENGITPIAGLVHHGSGPEYVNFYDGSFEAGLAIYAKQVAEKFPWIEYYTPVNEPLTTARFCGLYGHWYPHGESYYDCFKVLISECKATVLAMRAIREINPEAKLIQTEDLGKCHSTPFLKYQADFENERRWLSYELLCGTLTSDKVMYKFMVKKGIPESDLIWFHENNCIPHVAGFNYYLTSERYLDENYENYPKEFKGTNDVHNYADIHTVYVPMEGKECGPKTLLKEAWERLKIPIAITECHLHSEREDQIRWFHSMWKIVNEAKEEGVDIRAITAWAIFGLTGWNKLCTKPGGVYEPGVFNVSSGVPRPTALAGFLRQLTEHKVYYHPILENEGSWQRDNRIQYGVSKVVRMHKKKAPSSCKPLVILGKTGTLGAAFAEVCDKRNIHHLLLSRADLDLADEASIERVIKELNPWGIINAAGYVKVDEAERQRKQCMAANAEGPAVLAELCKKHNVGFLSYSSDLVFDGEKGSPYVESDAVNPLNTYGQSKARSEEMILAKNPDAIVVRTSSFFGPWDKYNFVHTTLASLQEGKVVKAANDVFVSPTYVPDLVNESLNLLMDGDKGLFHVTNEGECSWAELGKMVAVYTGQNPDLIEGVPAEDLGYRASRPSFSVLQSERGVKLPSLEDALERYLEKVGFVLEERRKVI